MYFKSLKEKFLERFYFGFKIPPFDGMQDLERMKFLYDCVIHYSTPVIGVALEIGCFKGCSTVFLAKACLKKKISQIYSIDLFSGTPSWGQTEDTFESADQRMKFYHLEKTVSLIRSDSKNCEWNKQIDVLHIDGDHEYQAVNSDLEKYVPFLVKHGILICDDYDDDHSGVKKAVHRALDTREDLRICDVHSSTSGWGSVCLQKIS